MDPAPHHRGMPPFPEQSPEHSPELVLTLDHRLRSRTRRRTADRRARRSSFFASLRRMLRLGAIHVEGVVYVARRGGSNERALRVRGSKSFDVRFPASPPMRLRLTPKRVYPDLIPCGRAALYHQLDSVVRPGARVGEIGSGTGAGAAWLAQRVGPTGSVQAWDLDPESVRFARRRYSAPWLAFEVGDATALATELGNAFDGIVIVYDGTPQDTVGLADPALRVVAPGGFIATVVKPTPKPKPSRRAARKARSAHATSNAKSTEKTAESAPVDPVLHDHATPDRLAAELLSKLGRSERDGLPLTPSPGWAGSWSGTLIRVPMPGEGVPSGQ